MHKPTHIACFPILIRCYLFIYLCIYIYIYLHPTQHTIAFHSAAALGLESANAVFHFSGFIYLAVFIGKLLFCRGSVCAAARAASVFGAFEFLFWCVSAALAAKEVAAGGFSLPFRRSPKPANEKVVAMEEGARA